MRTTHARIPALLAVLVLACGRPSTDANDLPNLTVEESQEQTLSKNKAELSSGKLRARSDLTKGAVTAQGIDNPLVFAAVAYQRSGMAQCWYEAKWMCKGPYSSECGGPVAVGQQGGICTEAGGGFGIFQLEAGTRQQTLSTYGPGILDVAGNIDAGVDALVDTIWSCPSTPIFHTRDEVIAWINSAVPGTNEYEQLFTAVASCRDSCPPFSAGCNHPSLVSSYKAAAHSLLLNFGFDYWYGATQGRPGQPTGLSPADYATVSRGGVTLTWLAVPGATKYDVVVYRWIGFTWVFDHSAQVPWSYHGFLPVADAWYAWQVTARNASGPGSASPWAYFNAGGY